MGAEWWRSSRVQGQMLHLSPAAQSHLRCVPPKRAAFYRPTPRRPPKQAAFYRPTPCRCPKQAAFYSPTPRRCPKQAAFYRPTPRRAPKQAAFCRPTPRRAPNRAAFYRPTPRRAPKQAAFCRSTPRRPPKQTAFCRPTPRRAPKKQALRLGSVSVRHHPPPLDVPEDGYDGIDDIGDGGRRHALPEVERGRDGVDHHPDAPLLDVFLRQHPHRKNA